MNLKIDDLLANVGKNESYQMLSDFSVLTGDPDPLAAYRGGKLSGARKRSTDMEKLQDDNDNDPGALAQANNDDDMNGGDDEDEDDDEEDDKKKVFFISLFFQIIKIILFFWTKLLVYLFVTLILLF